MKFAALLLIAPLTLASGAAFAQSTTSTTETTTSQPAMPSGDTTSTTEHKVTPGGAQIDRNTTTTQNPDGSTTTDHTKTITR
jgi:hypothetical protein